MRLQTKGRDEYVDYHHVPTMRAEAESTVILAALQEGLESLLSMVSGWESTSVLQMEGLLQNLVGFKKLRSRIERDLDKADVTLEIIEHKLAILEE